MVARRDSTDNVLELDDFRDFTAIDFSPAVHASKMMMFSATDDDQEVLRHYDSLLDQINELNSMDSTMTMVKQKYHTVQSSFSRIKTRLVGQHTQVRQCITQIEHAQALNETLRQIDEFLRLMTRLESEMAAGPSGYIKTAVHIYDIECIIAESDISGIQVVEADLSNVSSYKATIDQYSELMLSDGLTEQNQTKVAQGLQIFSNMHIMPIKVKDILERFTTSVLQTVQKTFDVVSLNAEMKEIQQRTSSSGGVRRINDPPIAASSSNVAVWANILWTRTEKLTDVIYAHALKLYLLDKVLKRKWDPVTRVSFQEGVTQLIGGDLPSIFWTTFSQILDRELKISTKGSQFLLQVLQAGYPRLLRVFHDLFTRISLVSGNTFNETDKSPESQTVLKTLASFESAYISRSLARLLDVVNSVFPDKPAPGQRPSASREDVDKIVRIISSELGVVKFDAHLLRLASKNIQKSLNMYTVKCENLSPTDASAYQIGVAISSSQQLNVDILNCLSHLGDSVCGFLDEYDETAADLPLSDAITNITKLMKSIVEPLMMSFSSDLEVIISKMHKEDYSPRQLNSSTRNTPLHQSDTTSAYFSEFVTNLKWISREILARLQCGDSVRDWAGALCTRVVELVMRHLSLVRPLNEQGKLRIAADLTHIEYFFNQFLGAYDIKLDVDLIEAHRSMRAFRHLLFMDQTEILNAHQLTHLSPVIVIHHIIGRSDGAIPLPMQVFGWSAIEYSAWLDSHTLAYAFDILEKCLSVYVSEVSRRGETQYCVECPIVRSMLSLYSKQYA
ncbi:hypothetical protein BSLG_001796 [Batrachochytrium salamandrivorans]|nr:hypothetical protein BSLG_001796 [Batrachochytrium salamandrivorans]